MKRILFALSTALAVGCATLVPPTTGTIALQPSIREGRHLQALFNPYSRQSIHHLLIKLYRLDGSLETPVTEADLLQSDLEKPIRFEKLFRNSTYRLRAFAYKAAGTDPTDLISASSSVDVQVDEDDRPTLATLTVQLIDQAFDGQASGSIQFTPGGHFTEGAVAQKQVLMVSTFAGAAKQYGYADGPAATARFDHLRGLSSDRFGNLYAFDAYNYAIRKISPSGEVSTLVQSGFYGPMGLAAAPDGTVYAVDMNGHRIRKVTPFGVTTTLAGGSRGFADGTGEAATFNYPSHIAVAPDGNLYVSDTDNHAIRKITPEGVVTTLAGGGTEGFVNGSGTNARFSYPYGIAVTPDGNIYVADSMNIAIRKVTPEGVVTTLRQWGFGRLSGLASDGQGNLYAADPDENAVHQISPNGVVTTLAGGYSLGAGYVDGTPAVAKLDSPWGVTVDPWGNLFVSEWENSIVRRIR